MSDQPVNDVHREVLGAIDEGLDALEQVEEDMRITGHC